MRIGFDGKRAAQNLTGLGNYSRWIIGAASKLYPQNQYLVYTANVKDKPQIHRFFEREIIEKRLPSSKNFMWRRMGIIKDLIKDRIQIYHGLSQELPFAIQHSKIKTVVTVHDLIFLRYPQYYSWLDRKIYKWKSQTACFVSNKIIAISENTKKDIIELYKINPEKVEVIYQSCDDQFKKRLQTTELNQVKDRYNLPEKYILYVGTIEGRKNLATLIKALQSVEESIKLVVVGDKKSYYKKTIVPLVNHLKLQERILFLENVDPKNLPGIYQNSKVFVLPSYYEGFGIPIIEALYSEIPVIAATGSCLEEAGGPNSIYVHPDDYTGFSTAIKNVLNDSDLRENMIDNGKVYIQKFDSNKLISQVMDCYNNLK